jgi:hypothetical protein
MISPHLRNPVRAAIFTVLPRIPGRRRHGGTDPHGHARFPALLPAAPDSIRRDPVPPLPGGPGAQPGDSGPHPASAPPYLPSQPRRGPGRGLPIKLLTATGQRCTSDVPAVDLAQTRAATGRGQHRDHAGASDSAC